MRGALALLTGFFGVLSGTEAAYYVPRGAASGDDFTGLVALIGGFVLLGIGAVTLWRSRRVDDGRRCRYLRRAAIALAVVVLIPYVLLPTAIATSSRTRRGRKCRPPHLRRLEGVTTRRQVRR